MNVKRFIHNKIIAVDFDRTLCENKDPETAVAIVKKWAKDHPEKKAKGNEK